MARKGIFHPRFFVMPELITIFLAVMLTDILLLDLFNTFGLPTSTTVSIVFELLGASVGVSLIKIYTTGHGVVTLVNYINTGKALAIIAGILLSIVIAFFSGAAIQFLARLIFTFDYKKRLKAFGGVWAGLSLAVITYFILIKGAKGTSFLTPESVAWIKTHGFTIILAGFGFFGVMFQLLALYTKIDILKPIVLIGTFALAMAFAGNDLVNFIGVPLAGLNAYRVGAVSHNPLFAAMDALEKPVQSNTFLLLIAGTIMVVTLWVSRKARTVTKTEVSLGRQEEGMERFSSSALSRSIVRMSHLTFCFSKKLTPSPLRRMIYQRLDPSTCRLIPCADGEMPYFDLLRASVNLFVASAVVSFATSLKLPLSTTYVTFMVAMGTSLSDQAWGRESAVYRVTGVLTVISGWFLTALIAFSVSLLFAFPVHYFRLPAVLGLLVLLISILVHTHRLHCKREKEDGVIEAFSLRNGIDPHRAINISFDQTGCFLKEISDSLDHCFDAALSEDRQRLRDATTWTDRIQSRAHIIIANIFETLFLLRHDSVGSTQKYAKTIRCIQGIAQGHREMIMRSCEHFDNYHTGFSDDQKEELRRTKTYITRLLWNASIMLRQRKRVDYDYIANQTQKLKNLVAEFDRNEIGRIQTSESKRRLSILFYGFLENSLKIAEQTRNLLDIFTGSFEVKHVIRKGS
jgi:hypothetical protein